MVDIFSVILEKKKKMLGYSFLYNLTYKSTKIYLNVGVFAIEISYFSRRIASKGQYCTPTPLALLAPVSQLSSRAPAPPVWTLGRAPPKVSTWFMNGPLLIVHENDLF